MREPATTDFRQNDVSTRRTSVSPITCCGGDARRIGRRALARTTRRPRRAAKPKCTRCRSSAKRSSRWTRSGLAELAAELALPDRLVEAIREARAITAWGGRKRQLQYVGKLMREIDPEPIRRRLDLWAHGRDVDAARQHALEQWRDRLIAEPATLDRLSAEFPRLDRPRFRALIQKARDERERGAHPHAFRELFRELKALDSAR